MKKIVILMFACMCMIACSSNKKNDAVKEETPQNTILILYYSQTGATASVANQLKSSLEADIEEIICEEPYSGSFEETIERCKKEHMNGETPAIKPVKSDIQKYDIVFLGYPIWFGTYASPIATLIKKARLEGKMIVPFCTFGSGGLETSISDLKEQLPHSIIMDGFGIRNARLNSLPEELNEFLIRNGYIQGEVEELQDFNVQLELTDADKNIFHQACDDYPYPLGTPTSVSKRYRENGTEYCFITRLSDDSNAGKMAVYVKLLNQKDAKPEFTRVVRN